MIRAALGGLAALMGLFLVWHWLLHDAVPRALVPGARVRTFELEEQSSSSQVAATAREAVGLVEERLEEPEPLAESDPESGLASDDGALPPSRVEVEPPVDAALIRRMLDVYARTVSPE